MEGEQKENDVQALPAPLRPADAFLQRFEEEVEHAKRLAFIPWREGPAAAPDITGWSRIRRIAYLLSSPWPTGWTMGSIVRPLAFISWVVPLAFWAVYGDLWFDLLFGTYIAENTQASVAGWTWADTRQVVYAVLAFLFGIAAYWSWIEFARDRRYSRGARIALCVTFVIVVGSSPFWLLSSDNLALFPSTLIENGRSLALFVVGYVLFVIPFLTFAWRGAFDVLLLGGRLFLVVLDSVKYLYEPIPRSPALQLVQGRTARNSDEIVSQPLTDLSADEREWMRRWAAAERTSAEKTLLPLGILLAGGALFANTDTFTNAVDSLYNFVAAGLSLRTEIPLWVLGWRLFLVAFVVSMLAYSAYALFSAFRSMVAYNMVLKACLLTEHAHEYNQKVAAHQVPESQAAGCCRWFFGLLPRR